MTDKRIIKTKNAIKTAFMMLMLEKDMNKITVSDIAERALVNRSTFYLHYGDVPSVMSEIENDITSQIKTCIQQFDVENVYESTYALLNNLTGMLDEAPVMKKFILYSTNSKYIVSKLKDSITQYAMSKYDNVDTANRGKRLYGVTFIASGIVDTYIKWCNDENYGTTLDELCKEVGAFAEAIRQAVTD